MVKALFPIGKTQWAKWNDDQRKAFNALRQQGCSYEIAVQYVNSDDFADIDGPEPAPAPEPKRKKNIFDVIENAVEDVTDVAATVGSVAAAVSPVLAVAKAVAKATKKKAK